MHFTIANEMAAWPRSKAKGEKIWLAIIYIYSIWVIMHDHELYHLIFYTTLPAMAMLQYTFEMPTPHHRLSEKIYTRGVVQFGRHNCTSVPGAPSYH